MLKHIVMWKLKENIDGIPKTELIKEIKKELLILKEKIHEIIDLEVGVNMIDQNQAYDLSLSILFRDEKALMIYQKHDDHQQFVTWMKENVSSRVVIDYIV